ncbi:hypothetical protein [Actinophytocola sediminis]
MVDIEKLRAELTGLTGGSRLGPLVRLGQALMDRYWRGGIGRAEGLPDLNAAIEVMEEAYGYAREGDAYRGTIAAYAGWFRCGRYAAHGESADDREVGLRMLEVALATPTVPPMLRTMSLVWAGQLYFGRVAGYLQSPGAMMNLMSGQVPPDAVGHADRAAECLREAVESGSASAELVEGVESMLAVVELLRTMLRGRGAGMDLRRLTDAMTMMQKFQDRFRPSTAPAASPSFLDFGALRDLLRSDVLDRPPVVLREEAPAVVDGVVEPEAEPVAPEIPPDRARLRALVLAALFGTDDATPTPAEVAALLAPDAPALEVDTVDEAVALARTVVDLDEEPGATHEDWFVLAVVLGLRHRLDDEGDDVDRVAGMAGLRTAVRTLPPGHPATAAMLSTLGAFLTEDRPFDDPLDEVAEEFADRIDAVLAAGTTTDAGELATLHALRCLCRTAGALAEFQRAPVPVEYPWRGALLAAARITEV